MTRAPTPLVSVLRGLIAKATEQPTMFGPANPELVPTKKVVRRKGGGTHVQTFYEKREAPPAKQASMFDQPSAAAPAPATRPSVLDALRAPERKPRATKKPAPAGGMFDEPPAEAPAPAAPEKPSPAAADSAAPEVRIGDRITDGLVTGDVIGEGALGNKRNPWPAWHVRLADGRESAIMKDNVRTIIRRGPEPEATEKRAAAGPVPPDLAAYFDRLKVPARRQYAQAVWAEMRGGPPADSVIELTDSSAGTGADMMARIRMKVERYAGAPKPAPVPEKPASEPDKGHYQADAAPKPATPGAIPPPAEQDDKAGRVAVRVLQAIGEAGGVDLLADLSAATDYHLRIEPPVKGMQPLVIEKHGRDIMLTHYRDQGGDRILDSEAIFRVDDLGQVRLHQTAVEDPWRGGENRGFDRAFARMLLHHLETDGYTTTGREHWRGKNAPKRDEPEPEPAGAFDDAGWTMSYGSTKIHEGLRTPEKPERDAPSVPAGLVDAMNGDTEVAAKVHAAITNLGRPDWQSDFMRSREVMNAIAGALGVTRDQRSERLTRAYLYARGAPEYGAPNGDPGIEVEQYVRTDSLHEGMTRTIDGLTYVLRRSNDGAGPLRWFAQHPEEPTEEARAQDLAREIERAGTVRDLTERFYDLIEHLTADRPTHLPLSDFTAKPGRSMVGGREFPKLYDQVVQNLDRARNRDKVWSDSDVRDILNETGPLLERMETLAGQQPEATGPEGAGYRMDAFEEYTRQGGRTRDRVTPAAQYVYASTLRPLGSFAPQIMQLVRDGTAEFMNRGMGTVKRDERAHAYVFSDAPLDPDITRAYQLTLVHEPPAAAGPTPVPAATEPAAEPAAEPAVTPTPEPEPAQSLRERVRAALDASEHDVAITREPSNDARFVREVLLKRAQEYGVRLSSLGDAAGIAEYKEFVDGGGNARVVDEFMREHAPPAPAPERPRASAFGFDAVKPPEGVSLKRAREDANDNARWIAKRLDEQGRAPSQRELDALAAFTGDGGLDKGDLYAHYTPTAVATAMWEALRAAGFEGGRVLEPSMGAGVFLHTAPDNATITGIEYLEDTGRIAKHLFASTPHTIHPGMPFEQYNATSTDDPFDAVIANPPYGTREIAAQYDKPHIREAAEYFIDATLDRLKDGGLAAFLINESPISGRDAAFRLRLMARADILTIRQLPGRTFAESSSAVPPIVIVARKRPHRDGLALARLADTHGPDALRAAGVVPDERLIDGTYLDDPAHILGTWDGVSRTGQYGAYKDIKGDLNSSALAPLINSIRPTEPHDALARAAETLGEDAVASARLWASAARNVGELPDGSISEDGKYILRRGASGERRWHAIADDGGSPAAAAIAPALDAARGIREFAYVLNNAQDPITAEQQRQRILTHVEDYLAEHGNPHENREIAKTARQRHELAFLLTHVNRDGTIGNMLRTPITTEDGAHALDSADIGSVAQHLLRNGSLNARNLLTWSANVAGGPRSIDDARAYLEEHYALDVGGRWTTPSDFYSGHVLDKARIMDIAATTAARENRPEDERAYATQAARLRALVTPQAIEDIAVSPRDPWMPVDIVQAYVDDAFPANDMRFTVTRDGTGTFTITTEDTRTGYRSRYGREETKDTARAVKRFERYLNFRLAAEAVEKEGRAPEEYQADRQASMERMLDEQRDYDAAFRAWAATSDHARTIEREYNARFNAYVPPALDGSPVHVEGWCANMPDDKKIVPHEYQNQSVRHALAAGNSIQALDVGLGKTHVGAMIAGVLLQEGRAKRPMIAVPKTLLANWRKHLTADLPNRRIVVIGETQRASGKWDNDTGVDVAQKLARVAAGEYDIVLITHNWLSAIPINEQTWERLVREDYEAKRKARNRAGVDATDDEAMNELVGETLQTLKDKGFTPAVAKKMLKARDKYLKRGEKAARQEAAAEAAHGVKAAGRKFDDLLKGLDWEALGIDALIADEAHAYKNLHEAPQVGGSAPKFMGVGSVSKRAPDFLYKSILTRERAGGKNVHLLTATPTKNSPMELFHMLKLVDHEALDRAGIPHSDAFLARYAQLSTIPVPSLDGMTLNPRTAISGFQNMRELRAIMSQYLYRRTGGDSDIVRQMGGLPARKDEVHTFDMHPDALAAYRALAAEAKAAANRGRGIQAPSPEEHVFSYMMRMQKLTLDPTMYDPQFANLPNPRFEKAAEIAKNAVANGGKALVFMDIGMQQVEDEDPYLSLTDDELFEAAASLSVSTADKTAASVRKELREATERITTNTYERLTQQFVNAGVPREQIAVITAATAANSSARNEIKEKYNAGQYRVVIGNTRIIGEGMSFQRGTTDIIHMDTPWDPGTMDQRLGRAIRQGNKEAVVRNHTLAARGSFDSLRMGSQAGKRSWTNLLWDSDADEADNPISDLGQVADLQIMLADDQEAYRKQLAEHTERVKANAVVSRQRQAVRRLRTHASLINAMHEDRASLTKAQQRLTDLRSPQRVGNLTDNDRRDLERLPDHIRYMEDRLAKLEASIERGKKQHGDSRDLPDGVRTLIQNDTPFVITTHGDALPIGHLVQGPGGPNDLRRIERAESHRGVDGVILATIDPLTGTAGGRNRPDFVRLADLPPGTVAHATAPDAVVQEHIRTRVYNARSTASMSPSVLRAHQDLVQERIRESTATTAKQHGRIYRNALLINDKTGAVRMYRDNIGAVDDALPRAGERYAVATPEDHAAVVRAMRADSDLASHVRSSMGDLPFDGWDYATQLPRAPKDDRAAKAPSLTDVLARTLARLGITMDA